MRLRPSLCFSGFSFAGRLHGNFGHVYCTIGTASEAGYARPAAPMGQGESVQEVSPVRFACDRVDVAGRVLLRVRYARPVSYEHMGAYEKSGSLVALC